MADKKHQRLYLAKGDKDIFVDSPLLPRHQYEGIRFLYRQFKKGKAGVILNDPPGYGKRVQILLFLEAVQPLLTRPILILCTEGREQMWTQQFYKWTNMGPEVSIYNSTSMIISRCLVSATSCVTRLPRREWSVAVIDDSVVPRDVLRSRLSTDYKIWLTSTDMRKNLHTFALIYKWFNPEDRQEFIVEDYQPTKKTPTGVLTKSVRLDAFMEDVVIRRKDVAVALGKSQETVYPAKVTRKNKDATGRKIKRSKPRTEDEIEIYSQDACSEPLETEFNVPAQLPKKCKTENEYDSMEDFTVKDNNLTKMDLDTDDKELKSSGGKNNNSNYKTKMERESDMSDTKTENKDEQVKNDKMEIEVNNTHEVPKRDPVMECDALDDSYKLLNSDNINSQNIIIRYDSDTPDIDDEIPNDGNPTTETKANEINCKNNQIESEDLFSTDADIKNDSKVNNHEMNEIKDELIEIKTDDINRNKNELANKNNVSEHNKTDPKLNGVELKMKQLEELAMKKFKGSILDDMF